MEELAPNKELSHYRIISKLGAGGMGEVWLAEDMRLGRRVALKLLPAEFTEDSERVRRFTLEAKAASALNHPNIIAVHDIGECETGRFIVMEFVAGRTLRSVIAKDNSLETFFTLGAQMARALSAAHAAGITHRDIKPDNIMVRDDGYVKMLDFGLARLLPTSSSDPEAMTLAQQTTPGTVMGTLAYMSPEQASGQTVGSPSDVFALGIVLYELATGSHPFKSETMIGYLHAITSQVPPPMTSLKSHLLPALDDLILRMLEKHASNRPTASEVAQALQEIEKYGSSNTLPLRIFANKPKAKRAVGGFRIAVLPFKFRDTDPDIGVLADGLSEEIVTGLSRFRYLSVVTSASATRLTGETKGLQSQLGTRYALEGSIRKAGSAIRVGVQLVDTERGEQLWSETYNRNLETDTIFGVQDDVAARIVATAADSYGVLVHSMRDAIRQKDDADLTPAEWQFQYFAYREQITPSNHVALKKRLERAAKLDNPPSDLWACLAQIYLDEYAFGFPGDDGTSLDRALVAARRSVELDRANQFAMVALAQTHFFRQDLAAFGPAAERAMALNPLNTDALGILGLEIVHTGEFERGTTIVRHAMELNPNHAGWMHFAPLWDHFHKCEYEQALECANRVDVPGLFWPYLVMASACGHLGRRAEAEAAVKDLFVLDPEFASHVRSNVGSWHFASGLMEPILEGLRKAGLEIRDEEQASSPSTLRLASVETRAGEGFWIAVLPFKFTGSNTEIATLAEGLSEEIITGLSRFSYLRVISRSSTLRYADETDDVRTVGKTLGARYVMEGSLRVAGASLRISVQLIDANTGAHLWAETYDRQFRAEDIFALQDDLVPRIVSTVADVNGVLPRSMSEVVCGKNPDDLSPYEAVLRSFRYFDRVTGEELAAAQSCLERAVEKAPSNADAWAMLALLFVQDYGQGFDIHPDALNLGTVAAQRAVEQGPSNHLAYFSLAQARFFQKDLQSFRNAAERAVSLNPMDANSLAFMGELLTYVGASERGLALATRAKEINPNHPGWFWYANFFHAYRQGDYREALALVLKANLPGHWGMHAGIAATAGQLGEKELANKALRDLLKLRPNYGVTADKTLAKWFDPELCEQLLDGLRKAGLEIADPVTGRSGDGAKGRSGEWTTDAVSPLHPVAPSPFLSVPASLVLRPGIVVLPFINRSPDADNEYFSDGLTEEIISDLSVIKALRVISRNSSMTFKGTSKDTLTIAKELGVTHVVSGSVRKVASDLRITAELIEVASDTPLWNEKYSGTMANVFGFQEEISRKIVNALQLRLTDSEKRVIAERPIDNAAAYDCYIHARHEIYLFTAEGLDRAQKLVDSGLALIGENPMLLATRGMVSWYYLNFSIRPEVKYLNEAASYAAKALERDPQNCFAIFLRGLVAAKRGDIESTLRDLRTAHEQRPGDSMVLNELIRHLTSAGQELNDSMRLAYEESLRLDPLHPLNWAQAAWRHFNAGRIDESREAARRIFHLTDRGNPARVYAAYYLAISNTLEEAIEVFEAEGEALAGTAYGSISLFLCRALQGDVEGTVKQVTPQLEKASSWTEYLALMLADGYTLIGQHDDAMKWLRTAVDQGFINYRYLNSRDPFLVNVRSDPRFAGLISEVKVRWEALAQDLSGDLH